MLRCKSLACASNFGHWTYKTISTIRGAVRGVFQFPIIFRSLYGIASNPRHNPRGFLGPFTLDEVSKIERLFPGPDVAPWMELIDPLWAAMSRYVTVCGGGLAGKETPVRT